MEHVSLELAIDAKTVIRIGVFVAFFTAAGIAIYFNRNKKVRRSFIAVFFVFLLIPGLTGLATWPFFPWQLYDNAGPTDATFYEMRVVDNNGNELRYDARAAHPIVGSISRRYARNMAGTGWAAYTENEAQIQGCYFLKQALEYRKRDLSPAHPSVVPRHQWDMKWTRQQLDNYAEFTSLRVYRVNVLVAENGTQLQSVSDSRIMEVNKSTCS